MFLNIICLNFIKQSTEIALNNAKILFKETYNIEMPNDQVILRLRPDAYIMNIENFPIIKNGTNFYASMWNILHRPYYYNAPETGDIIALTTRQTLELLININMDSYIQLFIEKSNNCFSVNFIEQWIYHILTENGNTIINLPSLDINILRDGKLLYKLTKPYNNENF